MGMTAHSFQQLKNTHSHLEKFLSRGIMTRFVLLQDHLVWKGKLIEGGAGLEAEKIGGEVSAWFGARLQELS